MSESDATIVRRVLAGDAEAFGVLVDRHHGRCLRLAVHLLGDAAEAEDAVQEAMLRAYRFLARYQEQERFGAWLTRIVVNQCRSAAARRRRALPHALDWGTTDGVVAPDDDAMARRDELHRALAHLPTDQREAVVLRYADDLSYDEMAAATGVSVAAMKMRVQRACRRLRALLAPAAPTPSPHATPGAPDD
jgi:RNA polymerase sigma-70 factor (ECF subfamily)